MKFQKYANLCKLHTHFADLCIEPFETCLWQEILNLHLQISTFFPYLIIHIYERVLKRRCQIQADEKQTDRQTHSRSYTNRNWWTSVFLIHCNTLWDKIPPTILRYELHPSVSLFVPPHRGRNELVYVSFVDATLPGKPLSAKFATSPRTRTHKKRSVKFNR